MRALGVVTRVPVSVERRTGNRGDGSTYEPGETLYAGVQASRQVRRNSQGQTITDPYVLTFEPGVVVPVGSRVTVDGEQAVVESSAVVRGAFGVPHHVEVRAL